MDLNEHFALQLSDWEYSGRGLLDPMDAPVLPEPPFRPFLGYYIPKPKRVDDGRSEGFFGKLLGGRRSQVAQIEDSEAETEDLEEEAIFSYLERGTIMSIEVALPPDFRADADAMRQVIRQFDRLDEPIGFEFIGTQGEVTLQFAVGAADVDAVVSILRAHFPDAIFKIGEDERIWDAWSQGADNLTAAVELGLARSFLIPLGVPQKVDPFVGIVGALSDLPPKTAGLFQVLFQRVDHDWGESIYNALHDGNGELIRDPDGAAKRAAELTKHPFYSVVLRIAANADFSETAWRIVTRLASALDVYDLPGENSLTPASNAGYEISDHQYDLMSRQSRRFGMLMPLDSLIGLVHLPSPDVRSPAFSREVRHTKAAPEFLHGNGSGRGLYLGTNEHHGERHEIYLGSEPRVRHMHVIGSPGTGKSTLLQRMIIDDIERGDGLALLDPHGDLVEDVLKRIPDHRIDDVVLLDADDHEAAVAFNILSAHSETEKTIVASDLPSIFERLSTSWGDQMNIVLRNAVRAFLDSPRGGTLSDLRLFLLEKKFREDYVTSLVDPELKYYWELVFPTMASKTSVGAVVTRLELFLGPRQVRDIVSQNRGSLDFQNIMDSGKILLCNLSQGKIGKDNAKLLGSLLVSKIQQTAMARQSQQKEQRRDFWFYVDEFQNFITPSMAEILAEARKYRLGMILAHQDLVQIQKEHDVSSAVQRNPGVRVVFRVGDADAKALAPGFSAFEAADLTSLETGEAICRVERSDHDFNLAIPFPEQPDPSEAASRRQRVIETSRSKYATPREQIEKETAERIESVRSLRSDGKQKAPDTESVKSTESKAAEKPASSEKPDAASSTGSDKARSEATGSEGKLGKGGGEHLEIQRSIQKLAEEAGFPATIEKKVSDTGHSVDVSVQADSLIGFEICVTTEPKHELGNLRKCVAAGYKQIVFVSVDSGKLARIKQAVRGEELPDGVFVKYMMAKDERGIRGIFDSARRRMEGAGAGGATGVHGGFKGSAKYAELSEEEARIREAEAIKLIIDLLGGEKEPPKS